MDIPTISPNRAATLDRHGASQPSATTATSFTLEVAKYINPRMSFDPETGKIVVQIRDSATGEVREQYRPDEVADAYGRSTASRQRRSTDPTVPVAQDVAGRDAGLEPTRGSTSPVERAGATSENRLDSLAKSV